MRFTTFIFRNVLRRPIRTTLTMTGMAVAVTFVVGLVPIVGNLISNTVIVIISLGVSWQAAAGSLIFLIVIHKLEYFTNARIVGGRIRAGAWEILLAMLLGEAVFGVSGLITAPIIYAYIKTELRDRRLLQTRD